VRALLVALSVALVFAGVAVADHLDPQERIRAVDQKRTGAMLLRKSDLARGFEAERTSGLDPHLGCRALDESDLVLTGKATSPYWARDYQIVGSSSAVYGTAADARASWRRSTSKAGSSCLRDAFRAELARQGEAARISIRAIPLTGVGTTAKAYRLAISGVTPGEPPLLFIDVVLLMHGRAQAGLLFAGIVVPPARVTEIGLAKVVAKRMQTAMRGSS
jgi:hypothetical protein